VPSATPYRNDFHIKFVIVLQLKKILEYLFELIKIIRKKISLSQVSNSWHLREIIEKEGKINWVGGGNTRDMLALCK